MKTLGLVVSLVVLLVLSKLPITAAQSDMATPQVVVADQLSLDGSVAIDAIYSDGPGFIVIHADNGEGSFGEVIGSQSINTGWSYNVTVAIDTRRTTPQLFAMLHTDTGERGVYEFAGENTPDGPVFDSDGNIITPAFNVDVIRAHDQFVEDNTVTISTVSSQVDGWLVIHAGDATSFGEVLGATQVQAGTTLDVAVELEGMVSDVLWPMLHVNTGDLDLYEFAGEGTPDGPVIVDGQVATLPIWTVPHLRVNEQVVSHADNYASMMDNTSIYVESVLSADEGWVIIHADSDGTFGAVAGMARIAPGLTTDLVIELDANATSVLWPMLHENTGDLELYEFAGEGTPDLPVFVNDEVVTFPVMTAPFISQSVVLDGNVLTIDAAQIDAHGWLIIHADNDGSFGEVLGVAPLTEGLNTTITIQLDDVKVGDIVWPMLHYDTGELGHYGFAGADTEDAPVFVGGEIVTAPLTVNGME